MSDQPFNPNQFDIPAETKKFDFPGQREEQQSLVDRFRTTIGGFETFPQISSRIEGQLGIPELRENVQRGTETQQDITSALRALPKGVRGRSRQSLVTQAQLDRIINAESQPLLESLSDIGGFTERAGARLSTAEEQLGKRLGLEFAEQERQLLPFEKEFSIQETQQAREFTGFTLEMQRDLDRLIKNQLSGVTLTVAERKNLNDLAIAESGYRNELDKIRLTGEQKRETKKAPSDLGSLFSSMFG